MLKEVSITIDSTQIVDGESDKTELFTIGTMEPYENGYRLHYDESGATGFEGSKVTVSVTADSVVVERTGKAISTLIIERGKKHHCHYGTEYGDFLIGVNTDEVTNNLNEQGGEVYLKYTLDINSSLMSENEMKIKVKEKK